MTFCCFVQVLQSCHDYPRVIEIMVNSYERLKPTEKWKSAIPDDCYKVDKLSTARAPDILDLKANFLIIRKITGKFDDQIRKK